MHHRPSPRCTGGQPDADDHIAAPRGARRARTQELHMMRYWRALPALLALGTGCAVPLEDEPPADGELSVLESRVTWEPCTTTARLLKDIAPGAVGSGPESLVRGEDGLFFTAD